MSMSEMCAAAKKLRSVKGLREITPRAEGDILVRYFASEVDESTIPKEIDGFRVSKSPYQTATSPVQPKRE